MRVKRYIVDQMPEAMQQIRVDLGSEAVILSTKELKVGGFLGMFQKKKIEVIAAVEKAPPKKPTRQPSSNHLFAQNNDDMNPESSLNVVSQTNVPILNIPTRAVPEAYKRTNEVLKSAMKATNSQQGTDLDLLKDLAVATVERVAVAAEDTKPSHLVGDRLEERETSPLLERQVKSELDSYQMEIANKKMNTEDRLLKEMREMKLWMAKMSRHSMMKQEIPASLQQLQDQLLQQELDEQLIEEWINDAFDYWEESGRTRSDVELQDFVRDKVTSFLSNRISGGIDINTKIVYVAGPTGVGKTTTIAKLAAEQLFRHHRKVGFITSDTYRISAVEQLRTYASILNVPLEVVQSPADLQRAMQRLDYCDLIFMDTAGRNYTNELLVSELQSLLSHVGNSETYLVLSLTSKTKDMMKITEHFSKYGLDKVIFTKLDETGSYGAIFNLIYHFPIHLSYLTNGQNVPDDLIMSNEQMLTNLLLGEGRGIMNDQAHSLRKLISIREKARTQEIPINSNSLSAKFITVSSGKGGVGKSNFTLNFALALQSLGKKVLIFDADIGMANIDVLMGTSTEYNLHHLIRREKSIHEIISKGPNDLSYISGGSGLFDLISLSEHDIHYFTSQIDQVSSQMDYIIFDTGAGLSKENIQFITAADECIVVTTPEPTSITDAYALIKVIHGIEPNVPYQMVINKVDDEKEAIFTGNKFKLAAKRFLDIDIPMLGYISDDYHVVQAVKKQTPFSLAFPNSVAAKDIQRLAKRYTLVPSAIEVETLTGIKGFMHKWLQRTK